MNGAVEMECNRECRLLLNDLNRILLEQCLEQRVRCGYLNGPVPGVSSNYRESSGGYREYIKMRND